MVQPPAAMTNQAIAVVRAVSRARRASHAMPAPYAALAIMPPASRVRTAAGPPSSRLEATTALHSTGITSDSHHSWRRMRRSIDDAPWIASAGRKIGPDPEATGGSAAHGTLSAPTTLLAWVANRPTASEARITGMVPSREPPDGGRAAAHRCSAAIALGGAAPARTPHRDQ